MMIEKTGNSVTVEGWGTVPESVINEEQAARSEIIDMLHLAKEKANDQYFSKNFGPTSNQAAIAIAHIGEAIRILDDM